LFQALDGEESSKKRMGKEDNRRGGGGGGGEKNQCPAMKVHTIYRNPFRPNIAIKGE